MPVEELSEMRNLAHRFENVLGATIEGKKPTERVQDRSSLTAFFRLVVSGREQMLSPIQRNVAGHILETLKKRDLTCRELQDLLQRFTCAFKLDPDDLGR